MPSHAERESETDHETSPHASTASAEERSGVRRMRACQVLTPDEMSELRSALPDSTFPESTRAIESLLELDEPVKTDAKPSRQPSKSPAAPLRRSRHPVVHLTAADVAAIRTAIRRRERRRHVLSAIPAVVTGIAVAFTVLAALRALHVV